MTGYVADLSWKSGARAIEKLDRLRSTMEVNVLKTFRAQRCKNWKLSQTLSLRQWKECFPHDVRAISLSIEEQIFLNCYEAETLKNAELEMWDRTGVTNIEGD